MKLNQLGVSALRNLGTAVLGKAVLAINAASALTVKTTSAIIYAIDGIVYTKAALAAQALTPLSGAFYTQPISTTVYYTLALDASGNVRVVQGTYAGQQINTAGVVTTGDGTVPDVPDLSVGSVDASGNQTLSTAWCPFGIIKVATNGSTTFLPGTDALDKSGCTFTFYDVMYLPSNEKP